MKQHEGSQVKLEPYEGNGVNKNGKFVLNDTKERRCIRAQIGTFVGELRPLLQHAAAKRVSCRFELRFPVRGIPSDA